MKGLRVLALLFLVIGLFCVPVSGQESADDGEETQTVQGLDVEAILDEDADVYAGRGYGYDPADRRDPFRSLARTQPANQLRGPRPEGKPGLGIDELDVTGVFVLPEGPVAQVQTSARDRSYLLRAGDKLFDGEVVSVSLQEVVFRQILDDPTALTPFREVVKRLNP